MTTKWGRKILGGIRDTGRLLSGGGLVDGGNGSRHETTREEEKNTFSTVTKDL